MSPQGILNQFVPISKGLNIVSVLLGAFINILLMGIVFVASTPGFGNYTKLMYANSINLIVFSFLHMVLAPILSIEKNVLYVFSITSPFGFSKQEVRVLLAVYGASYCFSLVICAITFVFRYDRVCNNNILFQTKKRLIYWLLSLFLISLIWALFIYFIAEATPYVDGIIAEPLKETYGTSLQNVTYVAAVYQKWDQNGVMSWNYTGILMGVTFSTIILGSVVTIAVSFWKVMERAKKLGQSDNYDKLQSELFKAQCIQAAIPLSLIFFPIFFLIALPIFYIDGNIVFSFVNIFLALFPIIDPIAIIFTVSQYRTVIYSSSRYF